MLHTYISWCCVGGYTFGLFSHEVLEIAAVSHSHGQLLMTVLRLRNKQNLV